MAEVRNALTQALADGLYLKLDATNGPLTGTLRAQHLLPDIDNTYDLGESGTPLRWRNIFISGSIAACNILPSADAFCDIGENVTPLHYQTIFLKNPSGTVVDCQNAIDYAATTDYTFDMGGGSTVGGALRGGNFTFFFDTCLVGNGENKCTFDMGGVLWSAANDFNIFEISSYNGIDRFGFQAAFGGFNNPNYGWQLNFISGLSDKSKILFFDNNTLAGPGKSIDFRMDAVNKMTIENTGYVHIWDALTFEAAALFSGTFAIGAGAVKSINIFANTFIVDWLYIQAATLNSGTVAQLKPNGSATTTVYQLLNSSTAAWGFLEMYIVGTTAAINTAAFSGGAGPTVLTIGETAGFLAAWTVGSLTTIDFYFNNAIEVQIQPNQMVFNAGALDPVLDWSVNGQLGLTAGDLAIKQDNANIFWGASDDVSMDYTGTVFYTDLSLQNPSDWQIDCGTDKTVELIETVWEDARIPIGAMINGATPPGVGTFFGSVSVLLFDPNAAEEMYLTIQIPHGYKEGTDIVAHVHWAPTNTNTNPVRWALEYQWQNIGAQFTGASTTITVDDPGNGNVGEHQVADFPTITGTGKTISSMLVCRLYRDAPADTYNADAALLEFDIHFEKNTLGSRQPTAK